MMKRRLEWRKGSDQMANKLSMFTYLTCSFEVWIWKKIPNNLLHNIVWAKNRYIILHRQNYGGGVEKSKAETNLSLLLPHPEGNMCRVWRHRRMYVVDIFLHFIACQINHTIILKQGKCHYIFDFFFCNDDIEQ